MNDPAAWLAPWAWSQAERCLVPPQSPAAAVDPSAAVSPWNLEHQQRLEAALELDPTGPQAWALALALLQQPPEASLRPLADQRRQALVGDAVTYVVNRNLNFTNHCLQH